jgi:hypothetical protein
LSDPDFLTSYADQVRDIPANLRPGVGDVDVAVVCTGKYPHEVLGQISDALSVDRPDRARGDAGLEPLSTSGPQAWTRHTHLPPRDGTPNGRPGEPT